MSNALKMAAAMAGGGGGNQSLYSIIAGLGLTGNLKICLDAGDAASYDPSVQTAKWLDTSGNGCDFYRGSSSAGDGAEPTFNGSAGGLSSAEYFSFDGNDFFRYDTTNEAWMQTLHKDGAVFSCFAAIYPVNFAQPNRIFCTRPSGATGWIFSISTAAEIQNIAFSGPADKGGISSSATLNAAEWNVVGTSVDEPVGVDNGFVKVNDNAVETYSVAYSTPSPNDASGTARVGALADGSQFLINNSRIACLAVWQGTALSATNLSDLFDAIKGRYGL